MKELLDKIAYNETKNLLWREPMTGIKG